MFLIGLTGGIGCGKSTISNMFSELDIPLIDSDQAARIVVEPGRKAWRQIRDIFGDTILSEDGQLDRKKLGALIFGNAQKRAQLNAITHPEIAKEIFFRILHYFIRGHQFVIIDSPLLFEVNTWLRFVHKVIVVSCDDQQQLERLMIRDNFTEEEATARISAQMPMEEKQKRANYIIYNNGSIDDTRKQVNNVCKELKSLKMHWMIRFGIGVILITMISSGYWVGNFIFRKCFT